MTEVKKYFIAIIPPEPFYSYCNELKNYFAQNYNSKGALNSPPHCTLYMPFEWREDREELLFDSLNKITLNQTEFILPINGFGFFEPRVVFINPHATNEILNLQKEVALSLKKILNADTSTYKQHGYHPHFTIAFRDLKKLLFPKAMEEFKEKKYETSLEISSISLLKHNQKNWEEYKRFTFFR